MSSNELRNCPFCGGEVLPPDEGDYVYWIDHEDGCLLKEKYFGIQTLDETRLAVWNTRAERTCKPEIENHGDLILTRYPCCGYELKVYRYSPYPEEAFNNCPNCGARVIGD